MSSESLKSVEYAAQRLNVSIQRAYELVREGVFPDGVVVHLGRQIRINPGRLEQFIAEGGQALPGGWRREPLVTPDATKATIHDRLGSNASEGHRRGPADSNKRRV